MNSRFRYFTFAAIAAVALITMMGSYFIVNPGHRGVLVTLGSVHEQQQPEGFGLKMPFVTTEYDVDIRQQTRNMKSECYSVDQQQVTATESVLYRIPADSVVAIFQKYAGDPFDSLVAPRVEEALKEVAATMSAEDIVKNREKVKDAALTSLRKKIGSLITIDDLVITNFELSPDLEHAIEGKMIAEQDREKAVFVQQQAKIDADTALIKATGEANAIGVRGKALRDNPGIVDLTIAERWNGESPSSVVVTRGGSNILLPLRSSSSGNSE